MKKLLLALSLVAFAGPAVAQPYPPITQTVGVLPTRASSTDVSGTVTTGGTYQLVQAANLYRKNCTIQNPANASEVLSIKLGTMAQPYVLLAGQSLSTTNDTIDATDAITVTAATNGHAFAGTCQ